MSAVATAAAPVPAAPLPADAETREWDAIVIGSGIGGLVTATQLAAKGGRVLVLERAVGLVEEELCDWASKGTGELRWERLVGGRKLAMLWPAGVLMERS